MSELERIDQNIGSVLSDMNYGHIVPEPHQARVWAPALGKKIRHLVDHHSTFGLSPGVVHMLKGWHRLVEKFEDVSGELNRLRQTSTVYYSVSFQDIPSNSISATATCKVPYSGTAAMLRGILLNSQITPIGGFGKLDMCGIDFTDPTRNGGVIKYDQAAGTFGVPTQRWMDPTPFLHDETAPWGARAVQFWVDWVLDPAAEIQVNWVNPDPLNTTSAAVNFLYTSTPCAGMNYRLGSAGLWHKSMGPEIGRAMNRMATAVFGLANGSGLPVTPIHAFNPGLAHIAG